MEFFLIRIVGLGLVLEYVYYMNKKFILHISRLNFIDQYFSLIFLLVEVVCFVDCCRSSSDQISSFEVVIVTLFDFFKTVLRKQG